MTGLQIGLWLPLGLGLALSLGLVAIRRRWAVVILLLGVLRGAELNQAWSVLDELAVRPALSVLASVESLQRAGATDRVELKLLAADGRSVAIAQARLVVNVRPGLARGHRLLLQCDRWQVSQRPWLFSPVGPTFRCQGPAVTVSQAPSSVITILEGWRLRFITGLEQTFSQPASGLAIGLTLGETRSLPPALVEDFRRSGTAHIMALSGYNVSVLVALLMGGLPPLIGRRITFAFIPLVLLGFLVLTGAPASLLRASAMASLLLLGRVLGRRVPTLRLLGLTIIGLLFVDPALIADVGFALSVVATAGLALIGEQPTIRPWVTVKRTAWTVLTPPLITLPIVVAAFGRVSLVAPFANLLVLPLVPILYLAMLGLGSLGVLTPALSLALATPVRWLASLFLFVVEWFGALPYAAVTVPAMNFLPLGSPVVFLWSLFRRKRACLRCQCPPVFQPRDV